MLCTKLVHNICTADPVHSHMLLDQLLDQCLVFRQFYAHHAAPTWAAPKLKAVPRGDDAASIVQFKARYAAGGWTAKLTNGE